LKTIIGGTIDELQPYLDELGDLGSLIEGSPNVLLDRLKELESISKGLQSEDTRLYVARFSFNSMLESTKYRSMHHYLGTDFVVKPLSRNFESAIIKIQQKKEHEMNDAEKDSVIKLLKGEVTDSQRDDDNEINNELSFESLKKKAKLGSHETVSNYIDVSFVEPTSNIAERLFSRVRKVWTEDRKRMLPSVLEVVMILKYNKNLWDVDTITKVRKNPRKSDIILELNNHDESARQKLFQEILDNDEKLLPNHFIRPFDYDEMSEMSDLSNEDTKFNEDSDFEDYDDENN